MSRNRVSYYSKHIENYTFKYVLPLRVLLFTWKDDHSFPGLTICIFIDHELMNCYDSFQVCYPLLF